MVLHRLVLKVTHLRRLVLIITELPRRVLSVMDIRIRSVTERWEHLMVMVHIRIR
jgi:hypothetical protein